MLFDRAGRGQTAKEFLCTSNKRQRVDLEAVLQARVATEGEMGPETENDGCAKATICFSLTGSRIDPAFCDKLPSDE
jgi:hypothetical protein